MPLRFPPFSLGQLLVLTWLAAIGCSIWFHRSGRVQSLFQPETIPWNVDICDEAPRVALANSNQLRVVDIHSGETIFERELPKVKATGLRRNWFDWPRAWNYYSYGGDFLNEPLYHPTLSFDGNLIAVQATSFDRQDSVVQIFEVSTGRKVHWRGAHESKNGGTFQSGTRNGCANMGVKIGDGRELILEASSNQQKKLTVDDRVRPPHGQVAIWQPSLSSDFVIRFSYDEGMLGTSGQSNPGGPVLFHPTSGIYDRDWMQLYDQDVKARLQFSWPFGDLAYFDMYDSYPQQQFPIITGVRYRSRPDRLGCMIDTIAWDLREGKIFLAPIDAEHLRPCGDRLFVHESNDSSYWQDLQTGARTYLVGPPTNAWFRTIHFAAWAIAWTLATKPKHEADYSRRFGYFLFITMILILIPPSLDRLHIGHMDRLHQWMFVGAGLLALFAGSLAAAIRRSVSAPLLISAFLTFGLLASAWIGWGVEVPWETPVKPPFKEAYQSLVDDWKASETDFFRPWRFGAPKPDNTTHIEFRDKARVAGEEH